MTRTLTALLLLLSCYYPLSAQHSGTAALPSGNKADDYSIDSLTTVPGISFRGLSAVNDDIVWVSGSQGTIGRSTDGGKNWKWLQVPGFEKAEFRDIEAFDAQTAVIMSIGSPAYLLKTENGGSTWKITYENKDTAMFLDAMAFWNINSGIVAGDAINGRFFIARTFDGGNSWMEIPEKHKPVAATGEALFAASGTNIRSLKMDEAIFVSGGLSAHLFYRDKKISLPMLKGGNTTGPNSIAVRDARKRKNSTTFIVVGGDFNKPEQTTGNCIYTTNAGKTWKTPATPPNGYRSCIEYLNNTTLITCGLTGVDISLDGGENFHLISEDSYHVCLKAKDGTAVYLAGNGKIGKLKVQ